MQTCLFFLLHGHCIRLYLWHVQFQVNVTLVSAYHIFLSQLIYCIGIQVNDIIGVLIELEYDLICIIPLIYNVVVHEMGNSLSDELVR